MIKDGPQSLPCWRQVRDERGAKFAKGVGGDEVKGTGRRTEKDQKKGRDQAGAQNGEEGKRTSKRVEGQKIRFKKRKRNIFFYF